MNEAPVKVNKALRSFSQFLQMIEDGRLHGDLSTDLEDLVAELQNHARGGSATKGSISISLSLKYDPKSATFEIGGDFKTVKPKEPRGRSIMWATPENILTLDNPRQMKMFPRDVNESRSDARSV